MAPEILSSDPNYTVGVDIWALGVMYHQMLFGDLPFNASGLFQLKELFTKMKKYNVPKSSKLSKESKDVLSKMLEKKVNKRITASALVGHKLFDDIRHLPFLS